MTINLSWGWKRLSSTHRAYDEDYWLIHSLWVKIATRNLCVVYLFQKKLHTTFKSSMNATLIIFNNRQLEFDEKIIRIDREKIYHAWLNSSLVEFYTSRWDDECVVVTWDWMRLLYSAYKKYVNRMGIKIEECFFPTQLRIDKLKFFITNFLI